MMATGWWCKCKRSAVVARLFAEIGMRIRGRRGPGRRRASRFGDTRLVYIKDT